MNNNTGNVNPSYEKDDDQNNTTTDGTTTFELNEIENEHDPYNCEKNPNKSYLNRFFDENKTVVKATWVTILNILVGGYFAWSTYHYIDLKNRAGDRYEPQTPAQETNSTEELKGRCYGYCGIQWCDGYGMLILLLFFIYVGLFYFQVVKPRWGKRIYKGALKPINTKINNIFQIRFTKFGLVLVILAILIAYIIYDTTSNRDRLRSLTGIFGLLLIGFIFSKHRAKINWRPVICGLIFQFLLGVFCIRWVVGRSIFECFGSKVATFLGYATEGSKFVYGNFLVQEIGVFAFSVLPVIFFFSFMIAMLYYIGAMQWFIKKLGWILQAIIGTTVCESLICAANIFLGMSESPLLIRPYIKYLTHSELHVIVTSGFATVSGTVLAAYISFGADPSHLITSSVMAAPAALCYSKLFYPETEKSLTTSDNIVMEKSKDSSILDAAANGAMVAISLVFGIIANLVAFVSFIAFANGIVNWLGYLVGLDYLTFEWIFSKLFIPLAWALGVQWDDCENVGIVIATKTIINEFVAYERLGQMKINGDISLRSSAIATYAICGFANPSSLGIMIGALSAMCPEKRGAIASVAFRGFIAGSFVCFITASIAGLLMPDDIF